MKKSIQLSSLALAVMALSACGGGAGSNHSHTANPTNSASQVNPITTQPSQLNQANSNANGNVGTPTTINPSDSSAQNTPNNGAQITPPPPSPKPRVGDKLVNTATFYTHGNYTSNHKFILLGQDHGKNDISLDLFPQNQLSQENWQESFNAGSVRLEQSGSWRVYNQKYSGVIGFKENKTTTQNGQHVSSFEVDFFEIDQIAGYHTQQDELPKMGTATYHGVAFDETEQGKLTYHVDFANKQGHGEITGLSKFGTVKLEQGSISNTTTADARFLDDYFRENQLGIFAKATNASNAQAKVDKYQLQFFGPDAKEVTGIVFKDETTPNGADVKGMIGFGGSQ